MAPVATDRALLARAVAVSTGGRGRTAPNPHVGCVVAVDGRIVGEGATRPVGGPHAEVEALSAAGDAARGATAYVTLEPCAHHGRTPPCSDALRDAGIARVVVAHPDPHPAAAGGVAALRSHGIEVEVLPVGAPLRAAVATELAGFLRVVRTGRPEVTVKLAQAVDGALSADRRWLTGPTARRAVHRWRATADAVMVGVGTVLVDDPRLDVRDVPLGERPQPRPVVLDTHARTPPHAAVVARGALLVTTADADPGAVARLRDAGAEVVAVAATDGGRVDLQAALRALAERGVTHVLAEPGRTLAQALVDADLVDRLVLHVADLGAPPFVPAVAVPAGRLATIRVGGAGPDVVWERARPGPSQPSTHRPHREVA